MIDVIVPAYIPTERNLNFFYEAMNSLRRQTLKDFNVKIILNGSDLYKSEIEESIQSDDRFEALHFKKKSSAAIARNYGIRNTSSKYVAQLDADDLYHEEKLEKQLKFMESNTHCSLLGTSNYVIRNGRNVDSCCGTHHQYQTHEKIKENIDANYNVIVCGSVMFRRSEVFGNNLFYDEENTPGQYWPSYGKIMYEDLDLWIRCINRGKKINIIPERLYYWREGSRVER